MKLITKLATLSAIVIAVSTLVTFSDRLYSKAYPIMAALSSNPTGNIRFELADDDKNQTREIIAQWYELEKHRQGGKFQSHGWWPWGVGGFDYDNDGDIDLYLSHHGKPGGKILVNQLQQSGTLTFTDLQTLAPDLPFLPGADDKPKFFDFDGDGWLDIAGLSDESKPDYLFNQQGSNFSARGKGYTLRPLSKPVDIADINLDGYLDLDGGPKGVWIYEPANKSFRQDTAITAIEPPGLPEKYQNLTEKHKASNKKNRFFRAKYYQYFPTHQYGLSANLIDLNFDGLGDMIIAGSASYGGDKMGHYLLRTEQGNFKGANQLLGLPENAVPIYYGDINNDHLDDLLVVGDEHSGWYLNSLQGFKFHETAMQGFLKKRAPYLIRAYPVDFDGDGDPDFVMNNPRGKITEVFENLGNGKFTRILFSKSWGANPVYIVDIDNDGDQDLILGGNNVDNDTRLSIFLNETPINSNSVTIYPRYKIPNIYGVGAIIKLYLSDSESQKKQTLIEKARWNGEPVTFFIGSAEQVNVEITYPDNKKTRFDGLSANRVYTLNYNGLVEGGYHAATYSKGAQSENARP
ncbi:CRTAC1 family protein [Thalassotalea mangrovi]|uniref:VCBS repeat-containing protein n=1 Tax=Thalassotalea mangrovi TaxID=2572245 RepID=A0A4U1B5K3_9GAMM|nr:CRTAC1 family protein [Thalassotalea mangrovi]TKB45643.1 VCBS repeat-containing protein [Thalassotalea mangrovi]